MPGRDPERAQLGDVAAPDILGQRDDRCTIVDRVDRTDVLGRHRPVERVVAVGVVQRLRDLAGARDQVAALIAAHERRIEQLEGQLAAENDIPATEEGWPVFMDIHVATLEHELLADLDPLTPVLNRRAFDDTIENEIRRSGRTAAPRRDRGGTAVPPARAG